MSRQNPSSQSPTIRNSGIDLLRPLLMVFVVANHLIWHGVGLDDLNGAGFHATGASGVVRLWMFPLVVVAVDCYVLITGFFGVRFRSKGFLFLILQGFLYSGAIALANVFLKLGPTNFGIMQYWFLIGYLGVALLAPYTNMLLECLDNRQLAFFLAVGFAFDCGLAFFYTHEGTLGINMGFSIWHLLYMYCVGRGLARFDPIRSPWRSLGAFFMISAVTSVIAGLLYSHGRSDAAYRFLVGNSPLVVAAAVCLFQVFRHFPFRWRLPVFVTTHVFGVYLLHTNRTIYEPVFVKQIGSFLRSDPGGMLWTIPVAAVAVLIASLPVCILLDSVLKRAIDLAWFKPAFDALDRAMILPSTKPKYDD